jgi:hypothetical protein
LIIIKITFAVEFVLLLVGSVRAQTATTYFTESITDYTDYWQSGTGLNLNALPTSTLPGSLQQLLAFTLNGQRYSTDVNNQLLTARGLSFTPRPANTRPYR